MLEPETIKECLDFELRSLMRIINMEINHTIELTNTYLSYDKSKLVVDPHDSYIRGMLQADETNMKNLKELSEKVEKTIARMKEYIDNPELAVDEYYEWNKNKSLTGEETVCLVQ